MGLASHGLAVAHDVAVPLGAPDMSAYAAAALADGADGVIVGVSAQDAINLIQATPPGEPGRHDRDDLDEVGRVIECARRDRRRASSARRRSSDEHRHSGVEQYRRRHGGRRVRRPHRLPHQRLGFGATRRRRGEPICRRHGTAAVRGAERSHRDPHRRVRAAAVAAAATRRAAAARVQLVRMLTLEVEGGDEVPTTGTFIDVADGEECPSPDRDRPSVTRPG